MRYLTDHSSDTTFLTVSAGVTIAVAAAVTNGDEYQCEEEEKARRFLIKIRFGFPRFVVLLCLECFRVAQICMQCLSIPFHYVYSAARRDPFFSLSLFAEITRSSRASCARPWVRRLWGKGRIASWDVC